MRKKITVLALSVLLLGLSVSAEARQPAKIPRVGVLAPGRALSGRAPAIEALRQGLRQLGYVEGKNIIIELRYAENKFERFPELAADLARLKVDVIVTAGGTPAAQAAKNAITTIPVVTVGVADPVALGLVASLARPGGNITGLSTMSPELSTKRLELVKEIVPNVSRVAVLWNPDYPDAVTNMRETQAAAPSLGIKLQFVEMREPNDLEQAFSAMKRDRADALVTINSPNIINQSKRVVDFAAKNQLPAMYSFREYVDDGGLMFYGASLTEMYRRAAIYVDKILKGAKPANLPIEQPTKFEFIINLKAAKQIGLTIPPKVLASADKVIR
jgi:putative tryptophan/tyrosine transport system substrate-binding protein